MRNGCQIVRNHGGHAGSVPEFIHFSRTKGLPTEIGVDFDAEKGLITENTEISNEETNDGVIESAMPRESYLRRSV